MKLITPFLSLSILLTSCVAYHSGTISSSSISKPFQYQDMAIGIAQSKQFMFLGGNSQDGLVLEAKKELMKNYPLKKNEEYLNFTIDFKRTYYPILTKVKVTVTADIVAIQSDTVFEKYSDIYKKRLQNNYINQELFVVGDSIPIGRKKIGVLISMNKNNRAKVQYTTKRNHTRTETCNINDLYVMKDSYRGLIRNDMFIYDINVNGQVKQTSGRIIAFGLKDFQVRDGSGNIIKLQYRK